MSDPVHESKTARKTRLRRERHDDWEKRREIDEVKRRETVDDCAGCDQEVQKDWTYCPHCGAQERK